MTDGFSYRKPKGGKRRGLAPASPYVLGKGLLVLLILAIGMLLYVCEQVTGASLAKEMSRLVKVEKELMDHNARLKAEIAYLSRSDRIKRLASEELGMMFPVHRSLALRLDRAPVGGQSGEDISRWERMLAACRDWLGRAGGVFGKSAEARTW